MALTLTLVNDSIGDNGYIAVIDAVESSYSSGGYTLTADQKAALMPRTPRAELSTVLFFHSEVATATTVGAFWQLDRSGGKLWSLDGGAETSAAAAFTARIYVLYNSQY